MSHISSERNTQIGLAVFRVSIRLFHWSGQMLGKVGATQLSENSKTLRDLVGLANLYGRTSNCPWFRRAYCCERLFELEAGTARRATISRAGGPDPAYR